MGFRERRCAPSSEWERGRRGCSAWGHQETRQKLFLGSLPPLFPFLGHQEGKNTHLEVTQYQYKEEIQIVLMRQLGLIWASV